MSMMCDAVVVERQMVVTKWTARPWIVVSWNLCLVEQKIMGAI